jgi:hypothetical protein
MDKQGKDENYLSTKFWKSFVCQIEKTLFGYQEQSDLFLQQEHPQKVVMNLTFLFFFSIIILVCPAQSMAKFALDSLTHPVKYPFRLIFIH